MVSRSGWFILGCLQTKQNYFLTVTLVLIRQLMCRQCLLVSCGQYLTLCVANIWQLLCRQRMPMSNNFCVIDVWQFSVVKGCELLCRQYLPVVCCQCLTVAVLSKAASCCVVNICQCVPSMYNSCCVVKGCQLLCRQYLPVCAVNV